MTKYSLKNLNIDNYLLAFISCELVELTKRHRVPDAFQDSFPFALNRSSEEVSAGETD